MCAPHYLVLYSRIWLHLAFYLKVNAYIQYCSHGSEHGAALFHVTIGVFFFFLFFFLSFLED